MEVILVILGVLHLLAIVDVYNNQQTQDTMYSPARFLVWIPILALFIPISSRQIDGYKPKYTLRRKT